MSDKRLPAKFLEDGLALAQGANFMGVPFEDFTKEELIAIAAKGWHLMDKTRTERLRGMLDLLR
jgi:hypothetical protein